MQTKPQESLQTPVAFNILGVNKHLSEMQEKGGQIIKKNNKRTRNIGCLNFSYKVSL